MYTPHPNRIPALITVLLLFSLTLLTLFASAKTERYPALWQTASLLSATVAILLIPRYLLGSYLYILTPPAHLDRFNHFSVVRILGKKRQTLCKLDLNRTIALLPAEQARKEAKALGYRITEAVSFAPSLFPQNAHTLLTEDGEDGVILVTIECPDELCELIRTRIPSSV